MKTVLIIGATGSLGKQVYDYIITDRNYKITALIAWNQEELVKLMAKKVGAIYAAKNTILTIRNVIMNSQYDIIVNCANGIQGISYTWLALSQTKLLVLGNKESLFLHGENLLKQAKRNSVSIIPLDSELTTLWYMINKNKWKTINQLGIMASGGSLKNKKVELNSSQILEHPIWDMGKQITLDSSTMINKIYEWYAATIFFKGECNIVKVFLNLKGKVHAAIHEGKEWLGFVFPPTMKIPIEMIFSNTYKQPKMVNIKRHLETINEKIYPLFTLKEEITATKHLRKSLLLQSRIQGNLFIRGLINYKQMLRNIMYISSGSSISLKQKNLKAYKNH